jgi:outer membrane lipopolysaccharide assembly protein LptE/RlpB
MLHLGAYLDFLSPLTYGVRRSLGNEKSYLRKSRFREQLWREMHEDVQGSVIGRCRVVPTTPRHNVRKFEDGPVTPFFA